MRPLIVVVLLLVAGCGANTRPSPPYAASATPVPTTEPAGEPTLEPTPEPEARVDPTVVAQGFTADVEHRLGELCGGHRESQLVRGCLDSWT